MTRSARSDPVPCSAWDSRSAAMCAGFAVESHKMAISLGPATISSATSP